MRHLVAVTAAGAAMLVVNNGLVLLALVLIIVVVVPAVHARDASKRYAAREVLRILLGRQRD